MKMSEAVRRDLILAKRAVLEGLDLIPHHDSLVPDCTEIWWAIHGGRVMSTSQLNALANLKGLQFEVLR